MTFLVALSGNLGGVIRKKGGPVFIKFINAEMVYRV